VVTSNIHVDENNVVVMSSTLLALPHDVFHTGQAPAMSAMAHYKLLIKPRCEQ
jgi:hypothetical protein